MTASPNSDTDRTPYRTLGRSGAVVFEQALGTMTFGAEADEATSHAIIDAYVAGGGNFIDTADVYSAGRSEEIIGRWLAAHPAEAAQIVIATKGRFPMGAGPNDHGTSRRHLRTALDDSLRRLGVEHIDLYQMHAWDAITPLDETLRFLDDAISSGQDRLLRVLELHRLAAHQSDIARRTARLEPAGDAAAAVQPAGARHRARDRPRALSMPASACCPGHRSAAAG